MMCVFPEAFSFLSLKDPLTNKNLKTSSSLDALRDSFFSEQQKLELLIAAKRDIENKISNHKERFKAYLPKHRSQWNKKLKTSPEARYNNNLGLYLTKKIKLIENEIAIVKKAIEIGKNLTSNNFLLNLEKNVNSFYRKTSKRLSENLHQQKIKRSKAIHCRHPLLWAWMATALICQASAKPLFLKASQNLGATTSLNSTAIVPYMNLSLQRSLPSFLYTNEKALSDPEIKHLKGSKSKCKINEDLKNSAPLVASYFGNFDDAYEETIKIADTIPWHYTNRVFVAFATLDDQNNLSNYNSSAEQRVKKIVGIFRKANPCGNLFISSGYGQEMDAKYVEAAKNPEKFAESVLKYLQKFDFDGYDMDWEPFGSKDYSEELKSLLQACHDLFQKIGVNERGNKYKVTNTIWPGVHSAKTVGYLADAVDQINIMSYGYNDQEPLINNYYEKGFPYHKMVLGVLSEMESAGQKEDILEKIKLVRRYSLGGIFSWRFDNDLRAYDNDPYSRHGPSSFRIAKFIHEEMEKKEEKDEP